jgi:hypothetical protein
MLEIPGTNKYTIFREKNKIKPGLREKKIKILDKSA